MSDPANELRGSASGLHRTGGRLALLVAALLGCGAGAAAAEPDPPHLLIVSRLAAAPATGGVAVCWQTGFEADTVSFRVWRSAGGDAAFRAASADLPALEGMPQGGSYRWLDPDPGAGPEVVYRLDRLTRTGRIETGGVCTGRIEGAIAPGGVPTYSATPHAAPRPVQPAASRIAATAVSVPFPAGTRVKIEAVEKGLYRLSADAVAAAIGMDPAEARRRVAEHEWRLTTQGQRCGWLPGVTNEAIYFYNPGHVDLYTDRNVFWLEPGRGIVSPPIETATPAGPADAGDTFTELVRLEKGRWMAQALIRTPDEDLWMWLYANPSLAPVDPVVLASPSALPAPAAVTARVLGASSAAHVPALRMNGTVFSDGSLSFTGLAEKIWSGTLDPALLLDGTNLVQFSTTSGSVYLDWIDLAYPRRYEARDGRLVCLDGGHTTLTVRGFASAAVRVADVTDPLRPRWVTNLLAAADGGTYAVSWAPPGAGRRYAAAAEGQECPPWAVRPRTPSALRSVTNAADYIVVTVSNLAAGAQSLAAHRSTNGWTACVADYEDICDAFNHGLVSPHAVRRFLRHAATQWPGHPGHVALAGAGSFDFRNFLGYGDNFIPALLTPTPFAHFSSDNRYGDIDDDGIPDLAVGRLPAHTPAQMTGLVARIVAYEASAPGAWTTQTLWAADNADPTAGDFPADSDAVSALLPAAWSSDKVYLDPAYVARDRDTLTNSLNAGRMLFNYRGHGNWNVLASESWIEPQHVLGLANGGALPVTVVPSCQINWFEHPMVSCLGEDFLFAPNGGAIAVWAPSGPSFNFVATDIDRRFVQRRFVDGETTLGTAVLDALRGHAAVYGADFEIAIFTLLGDPGLRMR